MNITNTWDVVKIHGYPEEAIETNVTFDVDWSFEATDGTYTSSLYGTQNITLDPDSPFIPYADLTEAQVINWVHSDIGAETVTLCEITASHHIADQSSTQ